MKTLLEWALALGIILAIFLALPALALADNCGSLTDCWNAAGAAAAAAAGAGAAAAIWSSAFRRRRVLPLGLHLRPSGPQRRINPYPAGPNGPRITFNNDVKGGPSTDLPVSEKTAQMIEKAVRDTGLSININSTTDGEHDVYSRHYSGTAVDINQINGQPVSECPDTAKQLQDAFNEQNNIRENFGPSQQTKTEADGTQKDRPDEAGQHSTHIHVSGQS